MVFKSLFSTSLTVAVLVAVSAPASAMEGHQHGAAAVTPTVATVAAASPSVTDAQVVQLTVTSKGFEPSSVTVKSGKPVKLVVTRKTERTCATEIVMKDFGVNQPLPLEKPVTIVVNPKGPGQYRFACSMNMTAGTLNVQ
jgi:plastocyanin domain-containing protein